MPDQKPTRHPIADLPGENAHRLMKMACDNAADIVDELIREGIFTRHTPACEVIAALRQRGMKPVHGG